jgi:hypothetical protein
MSQRAAAILAEALQLDEHSRAELAAALLASLDGRWDLGADAAWTGEIEHRVASIEAGDATLEPWDDVRRRIERDIIDR